MGELLYKIGEALLSVSVKKALLGAGLGLATYSSLTTILDKLINDTNSALQGGDSLVLAFLAISGMDKAISIVISAVVIRVTIISGAISVVRN